MVKHLCTIFPLLFLSCTKERNNEKLNSVDKDSINRINNQLRTFRDLWAKVEFDELNVDGYILPDKGIRIYLEDDSTSLIDIIEIDSIQPIHINGICRKKMPELFNDDYCKWSNLIKSNFKDNSKANSIGLSKILSGKYVYVVEKKHDVVWKTDTLEILETSNFDMESADPNGITGCDNFRIILVKSKEPRINLITWNDERKLKNDHSYARLYNSDGVHDEITKVESISDTIHVQIYSSFQEGYGTSTLKIFASENGFNGRLVVNSREY